jgi:hypothetical protein
LPRPRVSFGWASPVHRPPRAADARVVSSAYDGCGPIATLGAMWGFDPRGVRIVVREVRAVYAAPGAEGAWSSMGGGPTTAARF